MNEENFFEIEAGSIYAEGFAIVAAKVMRDKNISTRAKGLYSYLMTFVGQPASAWPDLDRVSNEMDLSKSEIPALLSELHSHGSISIDIKETIR